MELGQVVQGKDIGRLIGHTYIWLSCPDCGKERWIINTKKNLNGKKCKKCVHTLPREKLENNTQKMHQGYVLIRLHHTDFYFPMVWKLGLVPEHRLVMAKSLGRCLQVREHVHHKNGIRNDNRIENLELTTAGQHQLDHGKGYRDGYAKGLVDGRDKQIQELKEENYELLRQVLLLLSAIGEKVGVSSN